MQDYLKAKKRIFMNQDQSDYLILNTQDEVVKNLAKETKARVVYFCEKDGFNSNQAAVLAVASILGIDKELCLGILREFKGIEHRLELVAEINQVKFVNDSKATTVDSTAWALKNISSPVVLIAGGKDKGLDYRIITDLARKKVRQIVLIGEATEKIEQALRGASPISRAPTLEEAVSKAFLKAQPGDCVLLSPMCSSFDMFSDYEERGRVFKKAVRDLKQSRS